MKVDSKPNLRGFITPDAPAEDDLYKCVQCGFCLNACPTYLETGLEAESPRGRLTLMKAVNEGRLEMSPTVTRHWDLCLQCRACEVACPSGVPYGRIMLGTRAEMKDRVKRPFRRRVAREVGLNRLIDRPRALRIMGRVMRAYQRWGIQSFLRRSGVFRALPRRFSDMETSLPEMNSDFFVADGRVLKPSGAIRARVALLAGCVMAITDGDVMEAAVRVMVRNGVEVHVPKNQSCCGSLSMHVGERESAREMAMRNVRGLLSCDPDFVIAVSAGCGSTMKEYEELLNDDDASVREFVDKTRDVHEFLAQLGIDQPSGKLDQCVVFQDPCHLLSTQRIYDAPRQLLTTIPGLELVDMNEGSVCCGSAGTYSLYQREMSERLGDRKARNVVSTGADIVATGNPGCALQLKSALARNGSDIDVKYVVQLLDTSYRDGGDYT